MGKSTLAEALATVFSLAFKRVSFTSDLLPADLTGINVFNQADATFHFQQGPLFTQVLLADEINRAASLHPDRAELLLAMADRHQLIAYAQLSDSRRRDLLHQWRTIRRRLRSMC